MRYQYFQIDPGFKEDKWVSAVEIQPGNRAVVHHVLMFVRAADDDGENFRGGAARLRRNLCARPTSAALSGGNGPAYCGWFATRFPGALHAKRLGATRSKSSRNDFCRSRERQVCGADRQRGRYRATDSAA